MSDFEIGLQALLSILDEQQSINTMSDVAISGTPADNEILAWNSGTSQWINQTAAEAGLSAVGHTHTSGDISDFDTAVEAVADVVANTAKNSYPSADASKLSGIETGATADQTDSEIETAYNNQVAAASQIQMETGTETAILRMSPLRVAQAIAALGSGGGNHALLSATHTDTLAATVVRGTMIVGNSTPAWSALAIGTADQFMQSDGNDAAWVTMSGDATLTAGVLTIEPGSIDIAMLSATGTADNTTFLRGDNVFAVPAGGSSTFAALTDTTITSPDSGHIPIHNGAGAWVNYLLSGDITMNSTGVTAIGADKVLTSMILDANVTLAKMADIAQDTIIGRIAAGSGVPIALTESEVRTMLNVADGANAYVHPNHSGDIVSTADGATVIQPGAVDIAMLSATGTADNTTFLRGDNQWVTPAGAGGDMVLAGVQTITGLKTFGASTMKFTGETLPTHSDGALFYNSDENTLGFHNSESEVTLDIGQENRIYVRNTSGNTITIGSAVYISGAEGGSNSKPLISLAQGNDKDTAEFAGVATHDIENNSDGFVSAFGNIDGLNTSAFSNGDKVWLSPTNPGELTSTRPTQPNFTSPVGRVTRSHASQGRLLVHPTPLRFGSYTEHYVAFGGNDGFIKESSDFQWNNADKELKIAAGYIELSEITAPASAAAGLARLYIKDVGGRSHLFIIDDTGEIDIQAASSGLSNALNDGNIFVGNGSNIATGVNPSGDVDISNTGVFSITAGAIVDADINASALIEFSKMELINAGSLIGRGNGSGIPVTIDANAGGLTLNTNSQLVRNALTGDVTAVLGSDTVTINNDAVTYAKIQNVAGDNVLLGNISGAASAVAEITATQATAMLNVMTTSTKGLVPAPSASPDASKFLTETGVFTAPAGGSGGSGTDETIVKSVDQTETSATIGSTLALDDELVSSSLPVGEYTFELRLQVNSASTPDFKYSFGGTGTYTGKMGIGTWGHDNALVSEALTAVNVLNGNAIDTMVTVTGSVIVTVAGTFGLTWAQNVSDASNTTVLRGSSLTIKSTGSGGGAAAAAADTKWKEPVRVATTINGALSTAYENGDTVDGITLATDDRILLKNQTSGDENGIYTVNATGAPTRAEDFDGNDEVIGSFVFVLEGTANGQKLFNNTNTGVIVIDTTSLTFAEFSSGGGGSTQGIHDMHVPAASMWPIATAGCAPLARTELPTNHINIQTLDFDDTVEEHAQFSIIPPKKWNAGTITATFHWTNAAGLTTEEVDWELQGLAYADGDPLDAAFGTAQQVTDTWLAQNDEHISGATPAITVGGTPAKSERIQFQVARKVGTDDLTGDAKLIAVVIHFTTDADTDA